MGGNKSKEKTKPTATPQQSVQRAPQRTVAPANAGKALLHACINAVPDNRKNKPLRRIDIAAGTMQFFLLRTMGEQDRCSIAAFNDKYVPIVDLKPERTAVGALQAVRELCDNRTRLYDSIVVSVLQFAATANGQRPWLLVILTDGGDNGSEASMQQAVEALQMYNKASDNFAIIVGISDEAETRTLQRMANDSGSLYFHARDSEQLLAVFALIALKVVHGIQVDLAKVHTTNAEAVFAQVSQTQQLGRQPVEMLFLMDISGSMNSEERL